MGFGETPSGDGTEGMWGKRKRNEKTKCSKLGRYKKQESDGDLLRIGMERKKGDRLVKNNKG